MSTDQSPMEFRELLRQRREDLLAAASRGGASNLRVFGSVARGNNNDQSDIDFQSSRSLVDVAGLILDLQEILGVPVDVIEASTLRPDDEDILGDAVALESA